ncbi:MAG: hypothetical protein WBC71_07985 [Salaquimonas sp.]
MRVKKSGSRPKKIAMGSFLVVAGLALGLFLFPMKMIMGYMHVKIAIISLVGKFAGGQSPVSAQNSAQPAQVLFSVTRNSKAEAAEALEQISALDARCYATSYYSIDEDLTTKMYKPSAKKVQKYIERPSSDHNIENYMAMHRRSVDRVLKTNGADETQLANYVNIRGNLLKVMNQFFDEQGLKFMQGEYASANDETILQIIRQKVTEGSTLGFSGRKAEELSLLLTAKEEFVPCKIRALWNEVDLNSTAGPIVKSTLKSSAAQEILKTNQTALNIQSFDLRGTSGN